MLEHHRNVSEGHILKNAFEENSRYFHLSSTIAEGPGVAGEKVFFFKLSKKFQIFITYNTSWPPLSVHKKFSPIGPAV